MISCNKIGITKNCGKELKGKMDPDEPSGHWWLSVSILIAKPFDGWTKTVGTDIVNDIKYLVGVKSYW